MISINFSINTFVCLSASLKGIMRTFKRCRRTSRIGNQYLRSFSVFIGMIINLKTKPVFYAFTVYSIAYEKWVHPQALSFEIRQKLDPTKQIDIWPSFILLWHPTIPSFFLICTCLKMSIIAKIINKTSVIGIRIWICDRF